MKSQSSQSLSSKAEPWIALVLCAAVLVAGALEQLVRNRPAYAGTFIPALAATGLAAAGLMRLNGRPKWPRVRRALRWTGLLLMVWAANGLPFDLLRMTPLIPLGVDWPGLARRTLALAAAVVLARLALARPALRPPTQRPGTVTPRSCWRCPTRFSDVVGAGRDARTPGPARLAMASPHC
jgi:hypothetical protein